MILHTLKNVLTYKSHGIQRIHFWKTGILELPKKYENIKKPSPRMHLFSIDGHLWCYMIMRLTMFRFYYQYIIYILYAQSYTVNDYEHTHE